jgi:hypothetical protein
VGLLPHRKQQSRGLVPVHALLALVSVPVHPRAEMFASHPRTPVVCLYFASVLGFLAFAGLSNMNTRTPPPLRVCEFLLGCCMAFTLDTPVNGWLALTGLLGSLAYWISTRAMPDLFNQDDVSFTCALWPSVRLQPDPSSLLSTFSIVWCLLVQWLAASELQERDSFILRILHWDCHCVSSRCQPSRSSSTCRT